MTLDTEQRALVVETVGESCERGLPLKRRQESHRQHECTGGVIGGLLDQVGRHLFLLSPGCGGLGGRATDACRVSEPRARVGLGVGTAVPVTFLGTDPIVVGGTDDQKAPWMTRMAKGGLVAAYAVTVPSAGSDRGVVRSTAGMRR